MLLLNRLHSAGTCTSNAMWLSPIRAVSIASKRGDLGDLNPIPYPLIFASALAFTVYGILISDHWIFWANFPGAVGGTFMTLRGYAMASQRQQLYMERSLLAVVAVFFLASYATLWLPSDATPVMLAVSSPPHI